MRNHFMTPLAAGILLAMLLAPAALAQTAKAGAGNQSAAMMQQLVKGARPMPSGAELQDYKGVFDLDNGRQLNISGNPRRFLAQLDGEPPVELVATGPAQFTAKNGALRLQFAQHANGNVSGVMLRLPAN